VAAGDIDGLIIVPFHKPLACQVLDNHVEEAFLRIAEHINVQDEAPTRLCRCRERCLNHGTFY